jgi:hypothetical protein
VGRVAAVRHQGSPPVGAASEVAAACRRWVR